MGADCVPAFVRTTNSVLGPGPNLLLRLLILLLARRPIAPCSSNSKHQLLVLWLGSSTRVSHCHLTHNKPDPYRLKVEEPHPGIFTQSSPKKCALLGLRRTVFASPPRGVEAISHQLRHPSIVDAHPTLMKEARASQGRWASTLSCCPPAEQRLFEKTVFGSEVASHEQSLHSKVGRAEVSHKL